MGFYPVCSASGEYALGIPQFKRITVALRNGKTLEIVADKIGKEKVLTNVSFNGKKLERNFIKVSDVFNGGKLVFDK
jgi:putative alpha-1,2-mannosidase